MPSTISDTLDSLPSFHLPGDLSRLTEEIAKLAAYAQSGYAWLIFRNKRCAIHRSFNHRWRWCAIPKDPKEIRKTLRALNHLGFVSVCDGGWSRPATEEETKRYHESREVARASHR